MIKGVLYRNGVPEGAEIEPSAIGTLADGEWCWFDVVDPTVVDLSSLQSELGLHPLAVEDARHRRQRPKVEIYADHAFVVVRPLTVLASGEIAETEIHAFVSHRWLVTLRFTPVYDLTTILPRWKMNGSLAGGGTGVALHMLVDEVTDGYLSVVERLGVRGRVQEGGARGRRSAWEDQRDLQAEILRLRRDVVRLRRLAMPLRQSIDLLHEEMWFLNRELVPYYRDVAEHLLRSVELADNVRDSLTTILELLQAQAANQLNEVMKKLTAWAGIILVPTLIAGIYGMNFEGMPELHWSVGYPLALLMMVVASSALYVVFKRNDWL
jgi:magnesium transporter